MELVTRFAREAYLEAKGTKIGAEWSHFRQKPVPCDGTGFCQCCLEASEDAAEAAAKAAVALLEEAAGLHLESEKKVADALQSAKKARDLEIPWPDNQGDNRGSSPIWGPFEQSVRDVFNKNEIVAAVAKTLVAAFGVDLVDVPADFDVVEFASEAMQAWAATHNVAVR